MAQNTNYGTYTDNQTGCIYGFQVRELDFRVSFVIFLSKLIVKPPVAYCTEANPSPNLEVGDAAEQELLKKITSNEMRIHSSSNFEHIFTQTSTPNIAIMSR